MKINSINQNFNSYSLKKRDYQTNLITHTAFTSTQRVDKSMQRFLEFNFDRFPLTVKTFLESLADKFQFTPIETQKNAFIALNQAKNIQDVKKLFPQEELFKDLKDMRETNATCGLLGIYREFKDIYEDGILKNGEDLSVYILKKIFLDAEILDEINLDIESDLNTDIRNEFQRRYPNSDYIPDSLLQALGIRFPNSAYWNSLKFTREGYSDDFGLKVSEGNKKYWNSLTDEEKFEVLSKRLEGRDNWWNSLTPDEKLELAVGVDSEDDLYRIYQRYVRKSKKEIKEGTFHQDLEKPTKRITIGSKLKDKDIFILWFQKNIEKFYTSLPEADKDVVHIKRVRKLANRWQEMTPEERTELINKMREGREPLRYAMIDTWNHSAALIKELSTFLSAQQILRPVDLLYSADAFSEFQSKIMTEFWENHKDLAEEFGKNLSRSIEKIENSIKFGQFEDLKKEIERNRDYRKKMLRLEKEREEQKLKEAEKKRLEELEKAASETAYIENFREAYRLETDPNGILPTSYLDDMTNTILENYSKDKIEQITYCLKNKLFDNVTLEDLPPQTVKFQHALETAISNELCAKGASQKLYELEMPQLLTEYSSAAAKENRNKKQYPDLQRIERLYNGYKKDLSEQEMADITRRYFLYLDEKFSTPGNNQKLINYIKSYGRSVLIVFSEKSAFPVEAKARFYKKFLEIMPQEICDFCVPFYRTWVDVYKEQDIQTIKDEISRKYSFLPADFLNLYVGEVATAIRLAKLMNFQNSEEFTAENYKETMRKISEGEGYVAPIKIQKFSLSGDTKIKFLAAEQALADELFEITQNEAVYSLELEKLCNIFEVFSQKNYSADIKIYDGTKIIVLSPNCKPKQSSVKSKYEEYLNELQERSDEFYDKNSETFTDKEKLMYCLNPVEDNPERDEFVIERIERYIW